MSARSIVMAAALWAANLFGSPASAQVSPKPPPAKWVALIGEYGADGDTVLVLEREGRLMAFEGHVASRDGNRVFAITETDFALDASGHASALKLGMRALPRRMVGTEEGVTFRVTAIRPIDELRREALAATPPAEPALRRSSDLVELVTLDPGIELDIRYASTNNFLGAPMYSSARAFLQRPAAAALVRAHRALAAQGFGLLIHDAYRPWYVTKMFWDATTGANHGFVADPASGSRHNRGAAVDLTMCSLATGKPVRMAGGYDEMTHRSYADYPGGTSLERWRRDILRRAMEAEGFTVNPSEWWHFDFNGWRDYPILNVPFEKVPGGK
jgi:D-alanyl-D-alanine dipeptidase